jgi:hypothetical protein
MTTISLIKSPISEGRPLGNPLKSKESIFKPRLNQRGCRSRSLSVNITFLKDYTLPPVDTYSSILP